MRIEIFLQDLIDEVTNAKRTLAIQKIIGNRKPQ